MRKRTYQMTCPYCGAPAVCRPASTVYKDNLHSKGSYLYLCSRWPACDSYVSAHKRDRSPMGTLANGNLRHKRILTHRALSQVQKELHMDKWATYLWLEGKIGLEPGQTHIGMFSEQMCDKVIALCHQALHPHYKRAA